MLEAGKALRACHQNEKSSDDDRGYSPSLAPIVPALRQIENHVRALKKFNKHYTFSKDNRVAGVHGA